ncbi:hypothetical protein HYS72_03495 [Candidatus Pacearchaeota archaeon]|nr:hypothetical protein [Candidatus Pacearchaeota archaeon]
MTGIMTEIYENQKYLPALYDRLNQKPIESVERFRDNMMVKYSFLYSFFHEISPIKTKVEMNIRTANKVIEERV